jgi:hypothetical protein
MCPVEKKEYTMKYIRFGNTGMKVSPIGYLDDVVAATSVQLTPEQIQYLEEAYQPRPVVGFE